MKNDLIVKEVNFQNVNMVACKDDDGKISVSIRSICSGLGIAYNGQMERINRDDILPQGVRKIRIPTSSGEQEVNMLDIEFLPFFLTGIKSSMVKPEIAPKVVEFKLKAKDVLAQAFLQQSKPSCIEDVLIQSLQEMKAMRSEIAAAKEIAVTTKEEVQGIRDAIVINPKSEWRKEANRVLNAIGKKVGDFKVPKDESYRALEERAKCKLSIRLKNLQSRALMNGMTKSKVEKLNNLDVIENDARLKEIYIAIVKEMAIKHRV